MISANPLAAGGIAPDVAAGLARRPRSLPPKLFYDAEGSALFDQITELPEYYLTRTERAILEAHAPEMIAAAGENLEVIELGSGSASKTGVLLAAALRRQLRLRYCPIDVSPEALALAESRLRAQFQQLRVRAIVGDYTQGMPFISRSGHRRLALYLGSSIGNFDPRDAISVLRNLHKQMRSGDALLLGTDLRKSKRVLVPAYDDAQGVTARFNMNVLARINRELGADFDLGAFRHVAEWNPSESRMEMYLESMTGQTVTIRAIPMTVHFDAGERIHTENSYKYTKQGFIELLEQSGFGQVRTWTDDKQWFMLCHATAV
jgi:L-histidine Nalpha-methyltransferase